MIKLKDAILDAVESDSREVLVQPLRLGAAEAQNELLFFFKPECFLGTTHSQRADLLNEAFGLFERFAADPAGCIMMTGPELGDRRIMDRHYGFINRVSRAASRELSADDLAVLRKEAGVDGSTPVLGGHEFLAKDSSFDYRSLDELWASKKARKLRSGLYFESYIIDNEPVVLVNGFHPAQLAHFTATDRRLVLIVLHSDMPWRVLRSSMLGDTFPERAAKGSLRRILYEAPARFGLTSVSIANNASHLSAGPFEALFELRNFLAESQPTYRIEDTKMGQLLRASGAEPTAIDRSLQNPPIAIGGIEKPLFDATEDLDAISSAHLFKQMFLT